MNTNLQIYKFRLDYEYLGYHSFNMFHTSPYTGLEKGLHRPSGRSDILAGVIVGLFLLGKIIEGMFKLVMLDWLNKLLGVIFAMMKTALIVGFLILVFNSINDTFHLVSEKYLSESMLYPPLKGFADSVFPYLRGLFQ